VASRRPEHPNILFILSDDQGAWALGCAGNPEIRTPNLDRLAQHGVLGRRRGEGIHAELGAGGGAAAPAAAAVVTAGGEGQQAGNGDGQSGSA